MCWGCVFWSMDVVFAVHMLSFSCSKRVNVQSRHVHPSTTKYASPHVSIHAQPSMVFSFPTNHVIPWLFKTFPCQSQKPKRSQDTEKPHRKWSLRDYMYHVLPPIERLPGYSKCYFQHMINQYLLLFWPQGTHNVKKTNLLFPLGLLKLAKCPEYLYMQKPSSIRKSICRNILYKSLIHTVPHYVRDTWRRVSFTRQRTLHHLSINNALGKLGQGPFCAIWIFVYGGNLSFVSS